MILRRIYLDVCTLCRPYDDQTFARIHLETVAVQLILSAIEQERYQLVYSPVHVIEISAISDVIERLELYMLMQETGEVVSVDKARARSRAEEFVSVGIGPADAAHLAFAEAAQADFITCDDRLWKRCSALDLLIWVGNPVAFCEKEGLV